MIDSKSDKLKSEHCAIALRIGQIDQCPRYATRIFTALIDYFFYCLFYDLYDTHSQFRDIFHSALIDLV